MSTNNSNTALPSGIVIEHLLNEFSDFVSSGHTEYDEVCTIDDVKYIILCRSHPNEYINGMRVYSVKDGKHPELAVTLSMLEWET